ncbi:MAG: hypothetical protein JXB49_17810 [Bacteroidales bacterium]|nr:hypothetical protein [Bacteroidales bacterium]
MGHKLKRSLFIGLGGTGIKSILAVKQRLLEVYDPENMKDIPPMIEFLGFDTDEMDKRKTEKGLSVELEPAEFEKLSVHSIKDTFKANSHIRKRIPYEIQHTSKSAIHSGAGQIRALGTLSLLANYTKVKDALVTKVNKIQNWDAGGNLNDDWDTSGNDINIFIILSTSGGTGSGLFLDIAYIIRAHCNLDESDRLFSFIMLPEPFIGKKGTKNVIPNAYAAFKELDYLMEFDGSSNYHIELDYGLEKGLDRYIIDDPPFDYIYVISNQNENGVMFNDIGTLIDFIGYALFVTTGAVGAAADSIWDNLNGMLMSTFSMGGQVSVKRGRYLGFGISELYYDGDRVADQVANIISSKLLIQLLQSSPGDVDSAINNYIETKGLNESGTLNNDVIDRILLVTKPPVEEIEPDEQAIDNLNNIQTTYISAINEKMLVQAKKNCDDFIEESKTNLDEFIKSALSETSGLDYCKRTLGQLGVYLNTVKWEMDNELNQAETEIKQILPHLKNALADIKLYQSKRNWFSSKKKWITESISSFSNYLLRLGVLEQEAIRRREAKRFFANLISKVDTAKKELDNVEKYVAEAITMLSQEISDVKNAKSTHKPYSIELSYYIIKQLIVKEPDYINFIGHINNIGQSILDWNSFGPTKIKELVFNYSSKQKETLDYRTSTLEKELEKLDDDTRKKIVKNLDEMSAPVCQYRKGYVTGQTESLHIIGVENEKKTLLKEKDLGLLSQIQTGPEPTFSTTNDKRRWLIFKTIAALPGFALTNFDQYKEKYEYRNKLSRQHKAHMISFHINEGWEDQFPELIPDVKQEKALRYFSLAFSDTFNLIKRERGNYWIMLKVDDDDIVHAKHGGWEKISESQDRIRNYEIFGSNEDYINKIASQIDKIEKTKGESVIIQELNDYVERLDAEIERVTTHEMSRQLAREVVEIKKYIREFSKKY